VSTVWFILVAFMITAYVVLDGFDLGAGVLHLMVTRTDAERRLVLRSVGPVWDGNEVWLVAGGGTLYFAFPLLYASSFSGFYLPLMVVLWLLVLRAIGIEFRTHLDAPVWRSFFDGLFALSSFLLAIFFGAALGNVIRGVPLRADHYFFEALWTNWRVSADPGILDWYTVLTGLTALIALTLHGANYLVLKNEGPVAQRSKVVTMFLWAPLTLLTIAMLVVTIRIRPDLDTNYRRHPAWLIIPLVVAGSLAAMAYCRSRGRDRGAFLASATYLAAMLAGAAVALYPNVLPASTNPAFNLTIYNTATGSRSLTLGLLWWIPGIALAMAYFVFVYRMFGGKVRLETNEHGY
jgi:cytochrome bd ubiquinol oxidase subunit II